MRNRTVGINVRVTVTEKEKVTMLAKKVWLVTRHRKTKNDADG